MNFAPGIVELTLIGAAVVAAAVVILFVIFLFVRAIGTPGAPVVGPLNRDACLWAMLLHFSLLAGYMVPMAGLIVPIVIWQVQKSKYPEIDLHGRIVVNWMISELLYLVFSTLLAIVLIGVPLLIAVLILGIVFPIVGGIKANNGEIWRYPLSIPFLDSR